MYDNPPILYLFDASSIGSASVTHEILGPKGKEGRLLDYGVLNPSVLFTNVTTGCTIEVGTTSDANAYGTAFDLGALAADAGGKSIRTTYKPTDAAFDDYILAQAKLPADTAIRLTATAATGGTPAGTAQPFMLISWDK